MNKKLVERVERDEVEPEYFAVTLRLLQAELWTTNLGLYSKPCDVELIKFRDRLQRAIEGMDGRIRGNMTGIGTGEGCGGGS